MGLKIVGAGVGRTGTTSLKAALEQLLGGPCYHMLETFGRPQDRLVWKAAFEGHPPDWHIFLADYQATVDWPGAGVWEQLHEAFPDALVLLSVRDVDDWWRSASRRGNCSSGRQARAGSRSAPRSMCPCPPSPSRTPTRLTISAQCSVSTEAPAVGRWQRSMALTVADPLCTM